MNGTQLQHVRSQETQMTVRRLVERAVRALPQMFDPSVGMFCYKVRKTVNGLIQEGISPRYTVITLMGLHRLEQSGARSPIAVKPVFERMLGNTAWVDNIGDLGLLLWLGAQLAPDRVGELESRFEIPTALSRFADARDRITMHLAWFLTGLSYCSLASGDPHKMRDLARKTYDLLIENQGKNGYFGHLSIGRSLKGRVRGKIGSFADQVYPIYGLTQFSRAYGDGSALQRANDCARAICEAQGPLGQWWWHYDSSNARVFEQYPVFSVHQHGMGPMTLLALSKVSGENYDTWIHRGLKWINQDNELSVNMEDTSANVIWRCIQQSALTRYSSALLRRQKKSHGAGTDGLAVLFECRPYELGWLLYGLVEPPH